MLRERKGGCPWCSPPVAAATTGKARPRAAHLAAREWREREPQRLIRTMRTRASGVRSEEHTSELKSLMRISYVVFCLKKKIRILLKFRQINRSNNKLTHTIKNLFFFRYTFII